MSGLAAGAIAFALLVHCWVLWQPSRQVELHQLHLLQSVENRNWPRFARFIDDHYSDRWQHDKSFVTKSSQEVFRQFIWVTIKPQENSIRLEPDAGVVRAALRVDGSGGPLGEMVKERVNGLAEPFFFRWKKQSWKPWDWRLVGFEQAELELAEP